MISSMKSLFLLASPEGEYSNRHVGRELERTPAAEGLIGENFKLERQRRKTLHQQQSSCLHASNSTSFLIVRRAEHLIGSSF